MDSPPLSHFRGAVFAGYGLIADLVQLPPGTPGVRKRLREKAERTYTIPGTRRNRANAPVRPLRAPSRPLPPNIPPRDCKILLSAFPHGSLIPILSHTAKIQRITDSSLRLTKFGPGAYPKRAARRKKG